MIMKPVLALDGRSVVASITRLDPKTTMVAIKPMPGTIHLSNFFINLSLLITKLLFTPIE